MKKPKETPQSREIANILGRTGMTLEELAERAAVNPVTLSRVACGYQNAGAQTLRSIRLAEKIPSSCAASEAKGLLREDPSLGLRYIPVLSWAQAGAARLYEEMPWDWVQRIPSDSKDKQAFALKIMGDSMEPKFSEGEMAVLLPSQRPKNGDLVIANLKEQGPLFKIFHLIGRKFRLSSYNNAFPSLEYLEKDFHWIYPVDYVHKPVRKGDALQ